MEHTYVFGDHPRVGDELSIHFDSRDRYVLISRSLPKLAVDLDERLRDLFVLRLFQDTFVSSEKRKVSISIPELDLECL